LCHPGIGHWDKKKKGKKSQNGPKTAGESNQKSGKARDSRKLYRSNVKRSHRKKKKTKPTPKRGPQEASVPVLGGTGD